MLVHGPFAMGNKERAGWTKVQMLKAKCLAL
jgi:hypothetical protein